MERNVVTEMLRQSKFESPSCITQSQIQDFPKEGAPFRVKCHVDAIQWGGGSRG